MTVSRDDARRALRQRLELERMLGADVLPARGTMGAGRRTWGDGPAFAKASGFATRATADKPVGKLGATASTEKPAADLVAPSQGGSSSRLSSPVPRPPSPVPSRDPASDLPDDARANYVALRSEALACVKCGLCKTRTQVVFSAGTPRAAVMFVGEAPGADEDRLGVPFVGRAGQLLTRILAELGIPRESVYIANILKCRPPDNRKPEPDEVSQCFPYLRRQVEIVRPRVLCALGAVSAQALLGRPESITKIRGTFYDFPWQPGLRVMPTFHPAYLLRSPWELPKLKEDLRKIMAYLET